MKKRGIILVFVIWIFLFPFISASKFTYNNYLIPKNTGDFVIDTSLIDEFQIKKITNTLDELKVSGDVRDFYNLNDKIFVKFNNKKDLKIKIDKNGVLISEYPLDYIVEFLSPPTIEKEDISKFQISASAKDLKKTNLEYKQKLQKEHNDALDEIKELINKDGLKTQSPLKKIYEFIKSIFILNNKNKLLGILYANSNNYSVTGSFIYDPELNPKKEFYNVFNGAVLSLSPEQAIKIKNLEAVKKVYPDKKVSATLYDSVSMIHGDELWNLDEDGNLCNETGKPCLDGEGIKIAIIDTGIDYTHPDLGGCFGPGCKVIDGYDFINNDEDPMDDQGHGTHCAGIAAGDGDYSFVVGTCGDDICQPEIGESCNNCESDCEACKTDGLKTITGNTVSLNDGTNKLYVNSALNKTINVINLTHLPNILKNSYFRGDEVTKTIKIGKYPRLVFKKQPTNQDDPEYGFELSTDYSNPTYQLIITFESPLNFNDEASFNQEIELFNKTYLVSNETDINSIVLKSGIEKLVLNDNLPMIKGETPIEGTRVLFEGGVDALTKITVNVFAKDADNDALMPSFYSFTDPVFETFTIDFLSMSIPENSTISRENILISPDQNDKMRVSFENYENYESTIGFIKSSSTKAELVRDDYYKNISVMENEIIHYQDYVVLGNENEAKIFRLSRVNNATTGYINDDLEFTSSFNKLDLRRSWNIRCCRKSL